MLESEVKFIFIHLEKYRNIVLLLLLMSGISPVQAQRVRIWDRTETPQEVLKRYVDEKDTTDLMFTLQYIDAHFQEFKGQHIFALLNEGAKGSEMENIAYLPVYYSLIRQYYRALGDKPKTLEYALKLYHLLSKKGEPKSILWMIVDIGNIFYFEKDYDQARAFYGKAESIARKNNLNYALSVIYLNYGMIADQQKDYELALRKYEKSCEYRILAGNEKTLASTYVKMANTFIHLEDLDAALRYIHLTEEYYYHKGKPDKVLNETPMFIDMAYASYYEAKGNYGLSRNYLMNARKQAQENNFSSYYYSSFFLEAGFWMKQQKYKEAIACLNVILPVLKRNHLNENVRDTYKLLSKCFSKSNNLEKAEEAFDNYAVLSDSLSHSTMKSQLNTMKTLTAVFESNTKLLDARRNLEIAGMTNKLQTKQKSVFYWIFGIGSSALLVLLLLFLNLKNNKKKLQQLHFKSLLQNNEIKIKSTELQRSDQIKDKLFSIIAHDLRNPLNRLLVELAIVKKTMGDDKLIEPMENTLKETIGLFERLLQWSKMDNKQNIYSPVKINLNDNINKIITFYLPEMQLRQISIINNSETMLVFVDPNILQTLLRNFLSNAISVVSKGGTIEIKATVIDEENVEVVFSDSGPGFPEEVLSNFHVEKSDLNSASNGLGLTLCKVLAKMSGWRLEISNESNYGGARVSIVIPIFKEKKKSVELNMISRAFQPSDDWKEKLKPILEYKFYQTSQIRSFLKSLGSIEDPQVRLWIRQIEQAVHQGEKETYAALMKLIID